MMLGKASLSLAIVCIAFGFVFELVSSGTITESAYLYMCLSLGILGVTGVIAIALGLGSYCREGDRLGLLGLSMGIVSLMFTEFLFLSATFSLSH